MAVLNEAETHTASDSAGTTLEVYAAEEIWTKNKNHTP